MSKIIYRKVRTAPGLKLTDANWEQNAAYYAKAVGLETGRFRGAFSVERGTYLLAK